MFCTGYRWVAVPFVTVSLEKDGNLYPFKRVHVKSAIQWRADMREIRYSTFTLR